MILLVERSFEGGNFIMPVKNTADSCIFGTGVQSLVGAMEGT